MKKKLMIIAVAVILMLASTITVYANTETTVTLNASKTEVKVGETFTVTLKATCPDGINGIDTTYNYDEEKLELKSAAVANNSFSPLGVDNQITVICSSTEKIESADIYTLTFTVKEGVAAGSTAEIGITETLLDSDAATDSEKTIEAQKITVKIVEATTDEGGQTPPPADDGKDDTQTPPPADDGKDDTQTPPPADNGNNNTQKPPATQNKEPDKSTADKNYNKAGIEFGLVFAILAVILACVLIRSRYNKMRDI